MAEPSLSGAGVEALISRIRSQGLDAASAEAAKTLDAAREESARLLESARTEADAYLAAARQEIATEKAAAEEAIRLAIRDTILELRAQVSDQFQRYVQRLVSQHTLDRDVIKALLLVLAGRASQEFVTDRALLIELPKLLFTEEPNGATEEEKALLRHEVLGLTRDMLREGIELLPADDVQGGARVRLVGDDLEIDLTDAAVSRLLLKHLMPRYRAIADGLE